MNQTFTMKKLKSLLFAVLLCAPLTATAQNIIEINAENFPDAYFRSYLQTQYYGKDGKLTEAEIHGITEMNVSYEGISSLKGIEYFTALTSLKCHVNRLTSLDLSQNTALTYLDCHENRLTSLDLSQNTVLTYLDCNRNQLTSLDVSGCTGLTSLKCYDNGLTSLDLSQNTALTYLYCSYNQLASLEISGYAALTYLNCGHNQLTYLEVSGYAALTYLDCCVNQLTSLDASGCAALTYLRCNHNDIKGEAMDILINSLPENTEGEFMFTFEVYENRAYSEGNVCTKSQVSAAKAKGWMPYYHNYGGESDVWYEYEGMDDDAASIALPELATENGNAPVYNLAGQEVTSPVKGGIYIVNGKKVVVK